MAQKKWRQVKVKVNGRMVNRWTDGSGKYRLTKPAASGAGVLSNAAASVHNALGGNRGPSAGWRAAAEEQRNPRRSDGQLSPRPSKEQRKATAKPSQGPGGNPNGSGQGQARQAPPAPKLPPKPTRKPAVKPAPKPTPTPSSTPSKKSKISTYKAHGSNLHIGRHKTLAEHRAAVAKGKTTTATPSKPTSPKKKRTWLATNYKPNK